MFKLLPIKGHDMNKISSEIIIQQKLEQKKGVYKITIPKIIPPQAADWL